MSTDGKFGTFGGVYTPSVLTILGVIMYLRLPWVVGNAGLYQSLGIIVVAHIISVSTGLSISSIATDKAVGAGGPYYIVSRSLGLPIGGTLGLALFVGLAFSISLYVIGFSESFLSYLKLDSSIDSIRLCGTAVIVFLTIVTFISTALAIKTQYFILALIVLSLLSIGLGLTDLPAPASHLATSEEPKPLPLLFAIFFPAVTGFTAGVNMSGDLRSPKRSIPSGTMLAIATGFVVYAGLATVLALRVAPDALINDSDVLVHIAWSGPLVVGGIWGATVSSALGSILGSPRILQAVAADGIMPRFFAKGYGPTNEPRNALVLAFAIGEAGILIGELDTIARIVSMIFLATYGFLNLSCAIESWVSPDFRPDFRIPKTVSVLGAVTSLVVMIQLDLPAMVGATVLMTTVFLVLQRRKLRLESGDTWEGIWSSLVRSGLHRLAEGTQQRNWNPNVLYFRQPKSAPTQTTANDLILSLAGATGILTYVDVTKGPPQTSRGHHRLFSKKSDASADSSDRSDAPQSTLGVFSRTLHVDEDTTDAISTFCQHHGFAGVEPNTVLFDWSDYKNAPVQLAALLAQLHDYDYNELVLARSTRDAIRTASRIDIYWRDNGGNLPLSLSLARFITASTRWEHVALRFILFSNSASDSDVLRTRTRRYLEAARVDADIKVISNSIQAKAYEDWIIQESADATLILLPLSNRPTNDDDQLLSGVARILDDTGDILLLRASTDFEEVLAVGRTATESLRPGAANDAATFSLSDLDLSTTPAVAEAVTELGQRYEALLSDFDEHCVARLHTAHLDLLRSLIRALSRQFDQLEKGFNDANVQRRRNLFNRLQSNFIADAQETLEQHLKDTLAIQQSTLEGRIETFLSDDSIVFASPGKRLRIWPDASYFAPSPNDPPRLRRFKRRRRFAAFFSRKTPSYTAPLWTLQRFYADRAVQSMLVETVQQLTTESHQLAVQLGKTLCAFRANFESVDDDASQLSLDEIATLRQQTLAPIEKLVGRVKELVAEHRTQIVQQAEQLLHDYCADLDRVDALSFAQKHRQSTRARKIEEVRTQARALPASFSQRQSHLFQRAVLGMRVAAFHHRLTAIARRHRDAVTLQLRNGALRACEQLTAELRALEASLKDYQGQPLRAPKPPVDSEERLDPKESAVLLMHEVEASIRELPATVSVISDAAIDEFEEGRLATTEIVEVPVQALVQFLVESELIAGAYEEAERAPEMEAQALTVARDVVRLLSFQLEELDHAHDSDKSANPSEQLGPALQNGIERVEAEIEMLRGLTTKFSKQFDDRLQKVVEGSNAYELTKASSTLKQHKRIHQGRLAMSGAQGLLRTSLQRLRQGLVALLYRSSESVASARGLKARERSSTVIERMRNMVAKNSPRPAVLAELPFYYRQLFFGQAANDSLWVGREEPLARAKAAVQSHRQGSAGVLIVTGARGSGKSALCQRIVSKSLDKRPALWIRPPFGGSSKVGAFHAALQRAVDKRGRADEIFTELPDHSAIILDDFELWWDRSPGGFAVVDEVLDLVRQFGNRILFLFSMSQQSLALLARLRPITENALCVIECGPMGARDLGTIVSLRHGSTGMKYELSGRGETQLTQWQLAKLFSQHFAYCHGFVGAALRSWVTHMDKIRDGVISVRPPRLPASEHLDDLRAEWSAILVELMLHRRLTLARLERITEMERDRVRVDLEALVRMDLVVQERQRAYEINPFIHHVLAARFAERGLLR